MADRVTVMRGPAAAAANAHAASLVLPSRPAVVVGGFAANAVLQDTTVRGGRRVRPDDGRPPRRVLAIAAVAQHQKYGGQANGGWPPHACVISSRAVCRDWR